ncbi:MAG: TauD/TfdA family dioxygenase [Gammaproteobacteria bacterium]
MQHFRADYPPASAPPPGSSARPAHFSLGEAAAYARWRDSKLAAYPLGRQALWVAIGDPASLCRDEQRALSERCGAFNLAFYASPRAAHLTSEDVRGLGRQLGLVVIDHNLCGEADGIAAIRVVEGDRLGEYIPYTDRPLNWHTDGYYNPVDEQIRGVIMHCVRQAESGGESRFLDHEIAYILLRDENPAYVEALMAPDAMTIPANMDGERCLRPARRGPVFSIDPRDGRLHMRYTARQRSIAWKAGPAAEASAFLLECLGGASPYVTRVRFAPGQGVICNNVLHARSAFRDHDAAGRQRLLWRARYRERVAGVPVVAGSAAPGAKSC